MRGRLFSLPASVVVLAFCFANLVWSFHGGWQIELGALRMRAGAHFTLHKGLYSRGGSLAFANGHVFALYPGLRSLHNEPVITAQRGFNVGRCGLTPAEDWKHAARQNWWGCSGLGFTFVWEPRGVRPGWEQRGVAIPWWFLCLVFAITPVRQFWAWAERGFAAARVGHCSTCGYDLRATPDCCPECGRVAEAAVAAHPTRTS